MLWQQSQIMRFVCRNSQVYYDNLHNTLWADFPSRALLFKEALPCSLIDLVLAMIVYFIERMIDRYGPDPRRLQLFFPNEADRFC